MSNDWIPAARPLESFYKMEAADFPPRGIPATLHFYKDLLGDENPSNRTQTFIPQGSVISVSKGDRRRERLE